MQTEKEQFDELQTEETPAEETPTEETPTEETPTEETPTEETPTEETPAEETSIEETPVEETPTEETPAEEEPTEEPLEEQPASKRPLLERIKNNSSLRRSLIIGGSIGGFVCVCTVIAIIVTVIAIIVALRQPHEQKPDPTVSTRVPVVPTTAPTEPTLPPPEENPIAIGDFAMMGGYLTCLSTESVLGIDVSEWQGDIDWQKVKEAGIEYAMIRVGYRGWKTGELGEDPYAQANYAGASAAGVKVGAYIYSQAISAEEAVEEANYVIDLIKDWNVEMPVVFDWEPYPDDDARSAKMDSRTLTDCSKAFCDTVKAAGYEPMVYFNVSHSMENIYIRELTDYKFWLAYYDTTLLYPYKIDMWQYTETGSVPGIYGNVDINLYFPWNEE